MGRIHLHCEDAQETSPGDFLEASVWKNQAQESAPELDRNVEVITVFTGLNATKSSKITYSLHVPKKQYYKNWVLGHMSILGRQEGPAKKPGEKQQVW